MNEKIKVILKSKGISQKKLSDHLGIALRSLQKKLKGDRCFSIEELIKIKRFLNIEYDELLNDEKKMESQNQHIKPETLDTTYL